MKDMKFVRKTDTTETLRKIKPVEPTEYVKNFCRIWDFYDPIVTRYGRFNNMGVLRLERPKYVARFGWHDPLTTVLGFVDEITMDHAIHRYQAVCYQTNPGKCEMCQTTCKDWILCNRCKRILAFRRATNRKGAEAVTPQTVSVEVLRAMSTIQDFDKESLAVANNGRLIKVNSSVPPVHKYAFGAGKEKAYRSELHRLTSIFPRFNNVYEMECYALFPGGTARFSNGAFIFSVHFDRDFGFSYVKRGKNYWDYLSRRDMDKACLNTSLAVQRKNQWIAHFDGEKNCDELQELD